MEFPAIPQSKIYHGKTTPEQDAQMKLVQNIPLEQSDIIALEESVRFYEEVYPFLKGIDLSSITQQERDEIVKFLDTVLNYHVIVQNNIHFKTLFRITFVRDEFLENGKIRDVKFLSYPPVDVIKQLGRYGRANSPNSTCLYCAFNPVIALLETKPKIGERIIITQWLKEDNDPFVSFPIVNNESVKNEGLEKATKAFKERMAYNHPLFARTLELLFDFLSSEFIKAFPIVNPQAFEYLYSGYFSDRVLLKTNPDDYDCIIYPSVASKHLTDNLAIKPSSVSRIRPFSIEDVIVVTTDYDNAVIHENAFPNTIPLPIGRHVLRTSTEINNGRISWDDD